MALEPMTEGGAWMSRSADQEPVYVTNPDNIAHMQLSGWVIVPDPRVDPEAEVVPVQEEPPALVSTPRQRNRRIANHIDNGGLS